MIPATGFMRPRAWAYDTATNLTIEAVTPKRESIEVATRRTQALE